MLSHHWRAGTAKWTTVCDDTSVPPSRGGVAYLPTGMSITMTVEVVSSALAPSEVERS